MTKALYVAATSQNDGKTTVSLGLLHEFSKRFKNLGFIKPIGQQSVIINNERIDKDTVLIESVCHFDCDIKSMSPIAIPHGFTEKYLLNREVKKAHLHKNLMDAYAEVSAGKDAVIIEGTGHAGVGSVFDMNNAAVAQMLGSKAIIVARGGVGKPIDKVYLSKVLFEKAGVEILGVILNQVREDKYDKVKQLANIALENMGLKLLGVIPQQNMLSAPTMFQIKENLKGELINGDNLYANIDEIVVGAMTAPHAIQRIKNGTLLITPGDREDLIAAILSSEISGKNPAGSLTGIILTGGIMPGWNVIELIRKTSIPVVLVKEETYNAASHVHDLLVKIAPKEEKKIKLAQQLARKYLDVDYIIENL
ncbi:phosphotransacetylase family protein [Candidatus Margulisiibacteriota bacterium]